MWSKIKYLFSAVVLLLLAILLIVGYNYLKDPAHHPITTVKVDGKLKYVQREQLQTLISPYLTPSFFLVDVKSIQHALADQPWVAYSSVRRLWPDTLLVHVEEHEPLVYWGEKGIISQEAVLFTPEALPELALPKLEGPDEQRTVVLAMFNSLNGLLAKQGVRLQGLQLNARRAWQADLDNGMHIQMGSVDVLERFDRFVASYPHAMRENAAKARYVDLRYTNGFVIAREQSSQSKEQPDG
jgi:cell division protein FtsQ